VPRLTAARAREDRGAVSAIVAVVLGAGVLLGMATVVVDVGRLYAEREQLQSGADAAAWAVAEGCARAPDTCDAQLATASRYADDNAADGAAAVSEICGRGPGLVECATTADNRTSCLGVRPADVSYVEVRTTTRLPDGATLLPPAFAGALAGGAYEGTEVAACARVAWGPPRRATGFGVTFSACEWYLLTDGGVTLWPAPPAAVPESAEEIVFLKDSTSTSCGAGPPGYDGPGGFGWLDDPDDTCTATVEAGGTFGGDTGSSVSHPCRTALSAARTNRSVVLLPIYESVDEEDDHGSRLTYHLAGFTSFVITGFYLSGSFSETSWLTNRTPCGGSERCLSGYFTRGLAAETGEIGGPDLGTSIVSLVG
jgi:Flp pilus assembly protein TadG